jgi:predicted transcriptional regulator
MQITEAESLVMQGLWERHPQSAEALTSLLASQRDWQEATVKTLLGRLAKKGAVTITHEGRRFLYSPAIKRSEWISAESDNFLSRLFGGRVAPLVAHFCDNKKLSKKDVADLRRLIEKIDAQSK